MALSKSYEVIGDRENALSSLRYAYQYTTPDYYLSAHLGAALTEYGKMADAVEPLERANSLRPDYPYIMTHLGLAYFESNQFDKAIDILTRADALQPNDRVITMYLGVAKARRATLNNFQNIFDKVVHDPQDAEARTLLAQAYRYRGMLKAAEEEHLNSIRLEPKNEHRYKLLAIFYLDTGQIEKALEYGQKATQLKPNHVYYMGDASILRRLGRLDEALQLIRKSIEFKPSFVESHLELAELLQKKGEREAALREYQTTFDLASGDVRPNFALAWIYIRMGNKEGAIRHYRILKGIAPDRVKYLEKSIRAHFGTATLAGP